MANNKPDKFINQIASAIGNGKVTEDKSNELKVEKTPIRRKMSEKSEKGKSQMEGGATPDQDFT